jgi:eukaryotic-like serine/threonine-protein kinase
MVPSESDSTEHPTLDERVRPSDGELTGLADYVLGDVIGAGGMGEVVQARDRRIGRDVAIKRMRDADPSADKIERFLREAKIQARLDHPAIVPVHELGFDAKGRPFFTMKRLAGVTLASVIDKRSATVQRQLRALVEVCNAIDLAHARGVVHRDLKPSNIMLGDYGEVYVIDWGVARVLGTRESAPAIADVEVGDHTVTGQMLGTPGYMAPEQITGDADIGPPADVYALGSILFEVLAEARLHPSGSAALLSTVEGSDSSPALRRPDLSIAPELDACCTAALRTDPAARCTVRELRDRLEAYLDGDRDLERRRVDARALAERARTAERSEALRLAGRALALDPDCKDALEQLARMLLEPPPTIAPEVEVELMREEITLARARSRRAFVPFFGVFCALVVLGTGGIDKPDMFALVLASLAVLLTLQFINWKVRLVSTWVFFTLTFVVTVVFTRISGPFMIMPSLAIGFMLSLTSYPALVGRRLPVVLWTLGVGILPLALEHIGVFTSTWRMTSEGIVTHGVVYEVTPLATGMLVVANIAGILLIALYAQTVARDRSNARRDIAIQAWQLRQLLPA